jgi:AcrR family transcriptional regulator
MEAGVNMSAQPGRRRYDGSGRRARAAQTRETIVEVARRLFLDDGYAATTVAAIAAEAQVSVETIYKGFGGKPGLVRAVRDAAFRGTEPLAPYLRADELTDSQADAHAVIRGWGRIFAEVSPRAAPIELLVRDAAQSDPAMAELLAEVDQARLVRMTDNARRLARGRHLKRGLTVKRAGEILWAYTSLDLYDLLVVRRGWTTDELAAFVTAGTLATLLDD